MEILMSKQVKEIVKKIQKMNEVHCFYFFFLGKKMRLLLLKLETFIIVLCLSILIGSCATSKSHGDTDDDKSSDDSYQIDDSTDIPVCPNFCYPPVSMDIVIGFIANTINIVFNSETNSDMRLASREGDSWKIEKITALFSTYGTTANYEYYSNQDKRIYESENNDLVIVFGDADHLNIAKKESAEWSISEIADTPLLWAPFDSDLDKNGDLHIVFLKPDVPLPGSALFEVVYLTETDSEWISSIIGKITSTHIAITTDSDDVPHIAYHDDNMNALVDSRLSGNEWESSVVEIGEAGTGEIDFAKSSDRLYIAYYKPSEGGRFCLASNINSGTAWETECFLQYSYYYDQLRGAVHMVIGSGGYPILGLGLDREIVIARKLNDTWSFEYLNESYGIEVESWFSMSLSQDNDVIISYFTNYWEGDPYHGDLKFATHDSNGLWTSEHVWAEPVCHCEGS
jgi:hypothetical protein